ncbi:MAG: hypothetical protein NC832_00320, partial [Candidatus Omnitrophica bacterium]|nr:hypothetical protein [Candidatus Omnitrophota bacterium]
MKTARPRSINTTQRATFTFVGLKNFTKIFIYPTLSGLFILYAEKHDNAKTHFAPHRSPYRSRIGSGIVPIREREEGRGEAPQLYILNSSFTNLSF